MAAVDAAAAALAGMGHEVVDVGPPFDPDDAAAVRGGVVGAPLAPVPPDAGGVLLPLTRWLRARGARRRRRS